jgi:cardiolipin synthase
MGAMYPHVSAPPFAFLSRFISDNWIWLTAVVDLVLALAVTVHAVLWKRDGRAVIGWVGLVWLAPLVGAFAYFCFGVNRIQRKATALGLHRSERDALDPTGSTGFQDAAPSSLAGEFPSLGGLVTLCAKLTGRAVLPGNSVQLLVNGDEAYPAMLESIRHAKRSVALLSYIFDHDRAGRAFLDGLVAAQKRGVEIRVLIDDVGSKYSRPNMVRTMLAAGLTAASFLPTGLRGWLRYANLRNHRKILVVDGRIGFTGGTNIREGHWLAVNPKSPVQCLHFRLDGPVVAHLQQAFAVDWAFATGETLIGDTWFPEPQSAGQTWARGISHGPDEDFENMVDAIIGAVSVAKNRVRIVTPYFLPDSSMIKALGVAAMRGVEVEILLPATSNIRLVQWAATAQLWQLLEKGCRIFSTPPPFDHTKLFVVDDAWSLIGSTNWDPRSLRLNFEFNVECYDRQLARTLNDVIDAKLKSARQVTLGEINARPMTEKLRDGLARLLSPYL